MGGRDADRTTRAPGQPGVRLRFLDVRPARRRRHPAALDGSARGPRTPCCPPVHDLTCAPL
ncbi:DUF6207 family protein [Streptomyces sp. NPDC004285]